MGNVGNKESNGSSKSKGKKSSKKKTALSADDVKVAEEVAAEILPLTEGRRVAPDTMAIKTLFGQYGKIISVDANGNVEGQPFAKAFYYMAEAWLTKEYANENFGFISDYAALKDDYDEYKRAGTPDMASVKNKMNDLYELYLIGHKYDGSRSPFLINVDALIAKMNAKVPPFKEEEKQRVATTADERFVIEGVLMDPRTEPLPQCEKVIIKLVKQNMRRMRDAGFDSHWIKTYGKMYDLWKTATPEVYNKYVTDFKTTKKNIKKAAEYDAFLKAVIEKQMIPVNEKRQQKADALKRIHKASAAHRQYGNILMDDFGTRYHYKHNDDVAHVYGGYSGDLSHGSVAFKAHDYGPASINNESEVMFSVLVMMMIFIGGMVLCFVHWIWCAFAGYFFVSMTKGGKGKKKQYAPVERDDNDIERNSDSN